LRKEKIMQSQSEQRIALCADFVETYINALDHVRDELKWHYKLEDLTNETRLMHSLAQISGMPDAGASVVEYCIIEFVDIVREILNDILNDESDDTPASLNLLRDVIHKFLNEINRASLELDQ